VVHQRITLFNATGSVAAVVFGPNAIDLGATQLAEGVQIINQSRRNDR
jgi:hypothetical protein